MSGVTEQLAAKACDCEHRNHDYAERAHEYGALCSDHEPVRTTWGTYTLCKACRDAGHMHPDIGAAW